MQKRILLLGGSHGQLPAIKEANNRGLHTILCDYLPDNPGRKMVDEYYEVSTTDKKAVLDIAIKHNVDAVLAYASDPATPTAAYISQKLGIHGNSEKSISLLSNKNKFRKLQRDNNFNTPNFQTFSVDQLKNLNNISLDFPVVVKPVDASDTKGVFKVNSHASLSEKAEIAISFSKAKKVIVEEYIDAKMGNLHGDAFFADGEMVFCMLGDRLFNSTSSPLKPSTEIYPSRVPEYLISNVENEVSAITKRSGFKNGPVNIEARIDKDGNVYIMEIGPRSGGTLTPQAIKHSCGFDMMKSTFDLLLNKPFEIQSNQSLPVICYALHSNETGLFNEFRMKEDLKPFVKEFHLYVEPGDKVEPYSEPGSTIGVLILSFPDFSVAERYLDTLYEDVLASLNLKSEVVEFD